MPRLCAIKHNNLHQYLLKSRHDCIQTGGDSTAGSRLFYRQQTALLAASIR